MMPENVCNQCGNTFADPKPIDFEYSVETRPDGTRTVLTEPRDVSPCCHEEFEVFGS